LTLAYIGRFADAIAEGKQAVALLPVSQDAESAPYFRHVLARIYTMAGERDAAVNELEALVDLPYFVSPGWLRVDPAFASLRGDARFERLLARR
jgi:hypothetical protein